MTDDPTWRGPDDLRGLLMPIDELTHDPANPRTHDDRNLEVIRASFILYGQQKPLVVNGAGVVTAGNGTLAAVRGGPIMNPDTEEPETWTHLAVVRSDLSPAELIGYGIVDNRSGELAAWDAEVLGLHLGGLSDDGVDVEALGWADDEVRALIAEWDAAGDGDEPGEIAEGADDAPDVGEEAITQPGDVWLLGPHRLVCGDALDAAAQDAAIGGRTVGCVLMDPPYGIALNTDWSTIGGSDKAMLKGTPGGRYRQVEGDDEPYDAAPLRERLAKVREQFWFGADYYRRTLSDDDRDGSWLVWDKRTSESADRGIGSGFELVWSARRHKRDLLRVYWFGAFGDAEARNRMHPTQKPTKLLGMILDRWAPDGCTVADFYAGSGSTMIAAHYTGRETALIELDPLYCDVICRRWQQTVDELPVREATGERVDFGVEVAAG